MSVNELTSAASPYLLQHKDNPVHWREWSPRALAEAETAGKPVLLSIGYAACHWCHVMAHESFEDESTAALMNELFVNIKVDREERPDIDQIYMGALHALGQPGGWPLTMFVTPVGEPFWGGTYFPKEASHGRPSFKQLLQEVARVFRESPDRISSNTNALKKALTEREKMEGGATIANSILDEFAKRLYPHMDMTNGGMQGAPKFPNTQILEFFLRAAKRTNDKTFLAPVLLTLTKLYEGGIHDHVGGGFSRYSVDERWHVPHFEKMLYDNAQLLEVYATAWQIDRNPVYRSAAESIVVWLKREMIEPCGAFSASQDADSEGVEGKYYCWTQQEIAAVISPSDALLFNRYYDVQADGNWQELHTGARTNVLNRLQGIPADAAVEARLTSMRQELLQSRNHRVPPLRDDKILADWNGLMIAALARASTVFNEPEWMDFATASFHSVIDSMTRVTGLSLRIGHSRREGRLVWPGMSSDYAYMIRAALMLNENGAPIPESPGKPYLEIAICLARALIEFHADPKSGLLSLPSKDAADIIYRTYTTQDDATPNPNGVFLQTLQILASVTGDPFYTDQCNLMVSSINTFALKNPFGHASFLNAMDSRLNSFEALVLGVGRTEFLSLLRQEPLLSRFIIELDETTINQSQRFNARMTEQKASVFICKGEVCSLPVTETHTLRDALSK